MADKKKTGKKNDDPLDLTLSFEFDGKTYSMRLADFTGEDDLAIYKETGLTVFQIFRGGAITLFTIAGLLWRHRVRNGEPDLEYATVNRALDFTALETVTNDERESTDPEASGGS